MIADTTMPAFIISPRNRRVWEEIVVAAVASGKTAKEAVAIADDVVREIIICILNYKLL